MSLRAQRLAAELHRRIGWEGPPAGPAPLVVQVGVEVVNLDWPEELAGVLVVRGDGPLIGLNRRHSPVRRHFSFWHEMGHYFLHEPLFWRRDGPCPLPGPHGLRSAGEREADVFAIHVLMPEEWVRRCWRDLGGFSGGEELALARRFQVSAVAMGRRLRELGLSSRSPQRGTRMVYS